MVLDFENFCLDLGFLPKFDLLDIVLGRFTGYAGAGVDVFG